jgi:hypothetical protein
MSDKYSFNSYLRSEWPFDLQEKSTSHADFIITDPTSFFPTRIYLAAVDSISSEHQIERIVDRSRAYGRLSHVVLVTIHPLQPTLRSYSERRALICYSVDEFKEHFIKLAPEEKYVIGAFASDLLSKTYTVNNVYIEPDAVRALPSDNMEMKFLSTRTPALPLIDEFLTDHATPILFIFGGYGSGKSSLAAFLMSSHLKRLPKHRRCTWPSGSLRPPRLC